MKKICASLALAVFAGSFAFADDAEVLPAGVARLRIIPAYAMTSLAYDEDGKKIDKEDSNVESSVVALNGALEFGITDPITLGLKWAPGYYLSSTFDANDNARYLGPADLELGAKFQIMGTQGFVKNDLFRVALTPGISLPLDTYDAEKEFENAMEDKQFRPASSSDHQSFGFGAKADADYVINGMFFINLHGMVVQYLPAKYTTFETYYANALYAAVLGQATADLMSPIEDTETTYGLVYAVEFEPQAKLSLDDTTSFSFGLPLILNAHLADTTTYNDVETEGEAVSVLTIEPNASVFTMLGPLPVELELKYAIPLSIKNSSDTATFSAQFRLYYKFY